MSFFAQQITLDNHPDWIAVIDGRDGDMQRAARDVAAKMISSQFNTAVIVRESQTLNAGLAANAPLLKALPGANIDAQGADGDALRAFSQAMQGKGVIEAKLQVSEMDGAHIDGGGYYDLQDYVDQDVDLSASLLPYCMRTTLSFAAGGTCFVPAMRERFTRETFPAYPMPIWTYKERGAIVDDVWQAQDGDISVFKMDDWPEDHLPGVHFTPPVKRYRDPFERLIARTTIVGHALPLPPHGR